MRAFVPSLRELKENCAEKYVDMNLFVFPSAFKAIFTNLHVIGRYGPTTQGSLYTGQDHDGQVTLFSGIQQWTVPYTGVVTTE